MAYPGAHAPDRQYRIDASGIGLATYEWGDADAPPLLCVHGGFDFARTYDVFAPMLASAGWRVVSWDQRGHGDSDHASLYSWDADIRDALAVFDHVSPGRPVPVVGHSKGGGMMIQLGDAQPYRIASFVNLDGVPSTPRVPDVAEHKRTKMMAADVKGWLDHRRRTATNNRKPGTLEELARRAGQDEPPALAGVAAVPGVGGRPPRRRRVAVEDRPDDALRRIRAVAAGVDGAQAARPADAVPRRCSAANLRRWGGAPSPSGSYRTSRPAARCEILDTGHFVHIEQPDARGRAGPRPRREAGVTAFVQPPSVTRCQRTNA